MGMITALMEGKWCLAKQGHVASLAGYTHGACRYGWRLADVSEQWIKWMMNETESLNQ